MKVPLTTLFSSVILVLVLLTGQVRADWEQVASNVGRIVALEERMDDILGLVGMARSILTEDNIADVKTEGDIYFVYYIAAQVALAEEEMEDFAEYIEEANDSLDRMMEIIETPLEQQPSPAAPAPTSTEMRSL